MDETKKKRIGKYISLILRHEPEKIGLALDEAGWASVDALLAGLAQNGKRLSFDSLREIVETNDKQRYSFNEDGTQIRANQGHSLKLDLQLKTTEPPALLYHGTATRFLDDIHAQGLLKRSRHHVHLSADRVTAVSVGGRHGKPVILEVAAGEMHRDGYQFYCSENNVWLTDHVPPKYFS